MKIATKFNPLMLLICISNGIIQASEVSTHIQIKEDFNETTFYKPDPDNQKALRKNKESYEQNRPANLSKENMTTEEYNALQQKKINLLLLPAKREAIMQSKNKEIADLHELKELQKKVYFLEKENTFYKNSFQLACASVIVGGTALYLLNHCI